jgi:protein-L-isoaspartate O-methyltransferase
LSVLDLHTLDLLTSPAGAALLDRLAGEDLSDANTLALITSLRREHPPELAAAALELARLRHKAADKFGDDAARMVFTRDALEQASDPLVRRWRAAEARALGASHVLDACCSIGADALAFAAGGAEVLGLDIDPLRVQMARINAEALGLHNARFEVTDLREGLPPHNSDLIFYDPARRDEQGRRIHDVERYQPPLSLLLDWQAPVRTAKLSPGVDLAQLEHFGGRVDFVSVGGDLKEADLTLGETPLTTRAVLLTGDGSSLTWVRETEPDPGPVSTPRGWLIEPDPALIRAGLVQDAAEQFGAALLDETIAYITADTPPQTPWLRSWQVQDWMPFHLKRLRAYLRERDVGRITVKKRGSPLTPEELTAKLKLKGNQSRTVVLTRHAGEPIVIICADIDPNASLR